MQVKSFKILLLFIILYVFYLFTCIVVCAFRLTRYARGILKDWAVHGCSEQELKPVSIQIKPFNKSKSQTYVKKDDIAVNSLRQFMEVGDE